MARALLYRSERTCATERYEPSRRTVRGRVHLGNAVTPRQRGAACALVNRFEQKTPPHIRQRAVLAAQEAFVSALALRDKEARAIAEARAEAVADAALRGMAAPEDPEPELKAQLPGFRTRMGDLRGGASFRVDRYAVKIVVRGDLGACRPAVSRPCPSRFPPPCLVAARVHRGAHVVS